MNYIIIALLIIIIILLVVLLVTKKKNNNSDIVERLGKMETKLTKDILDFKYDFSKGLNEDFKTLNNEITNNLLRINEKVNLNLDENFKETNKTFANILERLSKIDEAQKRIDNLSSDIVALQGVLTDKKTRGIYGEVSLNYILSSIFGEGNKDIYKLQYTLSNGYIADSIIFAPEPLGHICIDSKFPLENYQKMVDRNINIDLRNMYAKNFKSDVKKHIDAIKDKYIIKGETSYQAIMFLPAEAIFAEINAYYPELVSYAYKNNVFITSPTTLVSTLSTISMILQNMKRDKYAKVIANELAKLSDEFHKYRIRWDKLSKNIDAVSKDVKDINITTDKITSRFASINEVNLKEIETKEGGFYENE